MVDLSNPSVDELVVVRRAVPRDQVAERILLLGGAGVGADVLRHLLVILFCLLVPGVQS